MKSKSFTLVDKKKKCTYANFRTFANRYFMLFGLVIFICILIVSNIDVGKKSPSEEAPSAAEDTEILISARSLDPDLECQKQFSITFWIVECSNGLSTSVSNYMDENFLNEKLPIQLAVQFINFPHDFLYQMWLDGAYKILSLTITDSPLTELEPELFNNLAFESLETLELNAVALAILNQDTFHGLKTLQNLRINNSVQHYGELLLDPLANTLQNFQFYGLQEFRPTDPKWFFGYTAKFVQLKEVHFVGNNFEAFINGKTFKNMPILKKLYLINTQITAITVDTFQPIVNTLLLLDMSSNKLKTLPVGTFNNLMNGPIYEINLSRNLWICDSELDDLIGIYKKYSPSIFKLELLCDAPLELHNQNIKYVQTGPSLSTGTSEDDRTTAAPCLAGDLAQEPSGLDRTIQVTCAAPECSGFVEIQEADIEFEIRSIGNNKVEVILDKTYDNFNILWFHNSSINFMQMKINYNDFGLGCGLEVTKEITIDNLKPNTSYTFCLIKDGDIAVPPFNCQSHFLTNSDAPTTGKEFIVCELSTLTITLMTVGLILAAIIGSFGMFCFIRWKPTVLKGSRRVLVVNKSSKNVLVFPKNQSGSIQMMSNRVSSTSNDTTMTNNDSLLSSGMSFTSQRRSSDSSVVSGRSYVLPNLYEAVHFRNELNIGIGQFDQFPQHPPPPPKIPKPSYRQPKLMTSDDFLMMQSQLNSQLYCSPFENN